MAALYSRRDMHDPVTEYAAGAVLAATALLAERNKHRIDPESPSRYQELNDRLEQLELKLAHLTGMIERMPVWVNQPVYPGSVTGMPSPVVTPGNPGTGDPIPSMPPVWCGVTKENANQ